MTRPTWRVEAHVSLGPRGLLRRVSDIYADRVDIQCPDPPVDERLAAASSERERLIIQMEETDVDRLKSERRDFLIRVE
ncbi:MAG: hypothetical protein ABJA81_12430 [Nocardioidaceae bacterium]